MDPYPSLQLLESSHSFPGVYQIKAIGSVAENFEERVLRVVRDEILSLAPLDHTARKTPDGRHVAITLDVNVDSAAQVRAIYAKIHDLKGLRYLL